MSLTTLRRLDRIARTQPEQTHKVYCPACLHYPGGMYLGGDGAVVELTCPRCGRRYRAVVAEGKLIPDLLANTAPRPTP